MINEIFPHKIKIELSKKGQIEDQDYILIFKDNSLLLKRDKEGCLDFPQKKDFSDKDLPSKYTYLFNIDNTACFYMWNFTKLESNEFFYKDIQEFRYLSPQHIAWTGIVAFQLIKWYLGNVYCGTCGSENEEKNDERALVCKNCKTIQYPKISPAIIVAIKNEDKILLARNSNIPEGRHSILAGYIDVGETIEETIIREVKEEVGLEVKNLKYYKSQPWPFSGSLMIGFFVEVFGDATIKIDNKEIEHADWYSRGTLPNHSASLSIAGEMIELFESGEW
ncbi:MAG: NAD(+) diphosphatase [Bacteroidales bacterium]|nr:NAD(+) diphosphatase [Bacteroidales bacterium]